MDTERAYYMEKALEALKEDSKIALGYYSITTLHCLSDMAKRDIYPDWRFSDDACNVWCILHTLKET